MCDTTKPSSKETFANPPKSKSAMRYESILNNQSDRLLQLIIDICSPENKNPPRDSNDVIMHLLCKIMDVSDNEEQQMFPLMYKDPSRFSNVMEQASDEYKYQYRSRIVKMYQLIIEVLKKKGITNDDDEDFYTHKDVRDLLKSEDGPVEEKVEKEVKCHMESIGESWDEELFRETEAFGTWLAANEIHSRKHDKSRAKEYFVFHLIRNPFYIVKPHGYYMGWYNHWKKTGTLKQRIEKTNNIREERMSEVRWRYGFFQDLCVQ